MPTTSDQGPQAGPVAAQPALVLAVVGAAPLDQLPEPPRMVHHLEMRDLVLDDVREHRLGSQQQPPAEAHGARRRATGPAARGVADLQLRIGAPGAERCPVEALRDLDTGLPLVPAGQRVTHRLLARLDDSHMQPAAAPAHTRSRAPRLDVDADRQLQPEEGNLAAI